MADTVLPEPLLHAYRATHYRVQPYDWFLQLGKPSLRWRPSTSATPCAAPPT